MAVLDTYVDTPYTGIDTLVGVVRFRDHFYGVSGNVLYRSSDGTAWTAVPGAPAASALRVDPTERRTLVLLVPGLTLAVSGDAETWVSRTTPGDAWFVAVGDGHMICSPSVSGGVRTVHRSVDGGATWTAVATLGPNTGFSGTAPMFLDGAYYIRVGNFLHRSVDGVTWTSANTGSGISTPDTLRGAVALFGTSGTVYYYPPGLSTPVTVSGLSSTTNIVAARFGAGFIVFRDAEYTYVDDITQLPTAAFAPLVDSFLLRSVEMGRVLAFFSAYINFTPFWTGFQQAAEVL